MKLFNWIASLFIGAAKDAGHQVVQDEIHKVHDEISDAMAPYLAQVPEDNRQAALEGAVAVAKQAAIAYAEAYINAHMPALPTAPETTK